MNMSNPNGSHLIPFLRPPVAPRRGGPDLEGLLRKLSSPFPIGSRLAFLRFRLNIALSCRIEASV